jgi:copper transport protein
LILAKAAGATVMLGFGWVHRRWLADRAKDVTGFLVSMRTEMLIGAAVLAVTAVLVNTRPAVDTVLQPVSTVAAVGGVTVQMEVTPARTGPNEVHLYFQDAKGLPSPIDAAELKVSSASVEPRRVPLTTITASHSTASGIQLTPGSWDFDLTLVRSGKLSTTTIEVAIK